MVQYGLKIRIYPNQKQVEQIESNFGAVRWLWNRMLSMLEERYKNNPEAKFLGEYDLNNILKAVKLEHPWLKWADSTSLQVTNKELSLAYKAFFKKIRKFPKYKSKKYPKQSYVSKMGMKILDEGHIQLMKLGSVKAKVSKEINGKIINVTVKKTPTGKFYAIFLIEEKKQHFARTKQNVGLDLGVSDLIITSDGQKFETIRFDKMLSKKKHYWEKRLARRRTQMYQIQAEHLRYTGKVLEDEDFKNYQKAKRMVAKYNEKIANQRNDYLHKITTELVRNYDEIHIEDLKTKNLLKNHNLARSIANQSWGILSQMLQYKSEWYGKTLLKVNPYKTSQLCSDCGFDDGYHGLGVREWTCPECGTHHDRDINAARNILAKTA